MRGTSFTYTQYKLNLLDKFSSTVLLWRKAEYKLNVVPRPLSVSLSECDICLRKCVKKNTY
jgi:hypothetical protein